MYILASFTFLLAWWRYLEFVRKKNTANSLLLGLGFILMGFSHFLTLFSLPVFFLWGLNQELGKKKKDWLLFFLPYLLFALSYLAYSPLFISQIKTGLGWQEQFPVWKTTVGSFSLKAAVLLPSKFVIGRIRIGSGKTYALISGILMLIFWGLAFLE